MLVVGFKIMCANSKGQTRINLKIGFQPKALKPKDSGVGRVRLDVITYCLGNLQS